MPLFAKPWAALARFAALLAVGVWFVGACTPDPTVSGGDGKPPLTMPSVEDHEEFFPIAAGPHATLRCNACHTNTETFKQFTCVDCHAHTEDLMAPRHSGISAFIFESTACLACHPDGTAAGGLGPEGHAPYFPIGTQSAHTGVGCAECHNGGTGALADCETCHASLNPPASRQHGLVRGYDGATASCKLCHADSQVHPVAGHLPFRLLGGEHDRESCLDCHLDNRTDKTWARNFDIATCTDCHRAGETNDDHDDVRGYRFASPDCIRCHPDGSEDGAPGGDDDDDDDD